jgi:signal transduction histidine kinase
LVRPISLIEKLQTEIARINDSMQIRFIFDFSQQIILMGNHQLILFKLLRNLFTIRINIETHHRLKFLSELNSLVMLTIRDDGIGFDARDSSPQYLGIANMRNRIEVMIGCIEGISNEQGTLVETDFLFTRLYYE